MPMLVVLDHGISPCDDGKITAIATDCKHFSAGILACSRKSAEKSGASVDQRAAVGEESVRVTCS